MRRSSMNKKIVSLMVVMFSVVLLAKCDGDKAKIAIGPVGSETNSASKVILGAYGLDEGDYEGFQEDFSGAADGVQDVNIDITLGVLGLPAGSIESLQASAGDVKMLGLSDEAIEYIEEHSDYKRYTIPEDSYDFLDEDLETVAAYALMVGNTDKIDEELGYELEKIKIENGDEVTHAQADQMKIDNALNGTEGLPIHPGAARYYEEQGLSFDNPIAELTAEESDRKAEMVLGTGSQGGTYDPLGGEIERKSVV